MPSPRTFTDEGDAAFVYTASRFGRRLRPVYEKSRILLSGGRLAGRPSGAGACGLARLAHQAVQLDVQVEQLAVEMVQARLQFADVAFGGDVDEIEQSLDAAVEAPLVVQEALAGPAQRAAQRGVVHHFAKEAGH